MFANPNGTVVPNKQKTNAEDAENLSIGKSTKHNKKGHFFLRYNEVNSTCHSRLVYYSSSHVANIHYHPG